MPTKNIVNWREIRDKLNAVPDNLLDQPATVQGLDVAFFIEEFAIVEEDLLDDGGEGVGTLKEMQAHCEEFGEEWDPEEFPVCFPAGTPVIHLLQIENTNQ